jgi:hypothetical protein
VDTLTLVIALIIVCGLVGTLIGAAIEQTIKARRKEAAKPQIAEVKTGPLSTPEKLTSGPGLAVGLNEALEERGGPPLKELDDLDGGPDPKPDWLRDIISRRRASPLL